MTDKYKNIFNLKRHTILSRIMLPGMAVMLIQSVIYCVVFWHYNVINRIETNAYEIFNEKVLNRQQDIQSDVLHKAADINSNKERLLALIYHALDKYHAGVEDIRTDAQLNQRVVSDVSEYLVQTMRAKMADGIFLVLDGPTTTVYSAGEIPRAGVYIRSFDNSAASPDNSDLLLERGMPALSRKLGISLDSYWSAGFDFSDKAPEQSRFFFEPLNAAEKYRYSNIEDLGYWSESFSLTDNDIRIITYSVPLISADGTPLGVFGIEIAERQLISKMRYQILSPNQTASYLIGVSSDGGKTYRRQVANGPLFKYLYHNTEIVTVADNIYQNTYRLEAPDTNTVCGSIVPFALYRANTPYHNSQWALIGMVEQKNLLSFASVIKGMSQLSLFSSLLLGIIGVFIIGKLVTRPITALVQDLKYSDPTQPISLKKLHINEIDELTVSIENLSRSLTSAAENIAKIFAMTQISVGVFEYSDNLNSVFCSSNLLSILGWHEKPEKDYIFLPKEEFERRMLEMNPHIFEQNTLVFQPDGRYSHSCWLQINLLKDNGKILGAVSDVTYEITEKQKIEYERDYDSLTNLYGLRAFRARLSSLFFYDALGVAALVMWDLDNLKQINDRFGHDFGDRYIRALSECLEEFGKHNALVARRSGDEFYTLLYGYDSKEAIRAILAEVWQKMQEKRILLPDGQECLVGVSAGLAWFPEDCASDDALMHFADFALYRVKHSDKGSIREFDRALYNKDVAAQSGYRAITRFIEEALYKFALQPIVSVENGTIFGYEMLMRSLLPEIQTPGEVLNLAQTYAKLYEIERISLLGGIHAFAAFAEQNLIDEHAHIFINSIGNQVLSTANIEWYLQTYKKYLSRVVIEITAGGRDNSSCTQLKSEIIKKTNGKLAIDNFGAGYNSDSLLTYVSPDFIKVDMSLMREIDSNVTHQKNLEAVIANAKKHRVAVIVQGIESKEALYTAVLYGADYVQGFYIGRPSLEVTPLSGAVTELLARARQLRDKNAVTTSPAYRTKD